MLRKLHGLAQIGGGSDDDSLIGSAWDVLLVLCVMSLWLYILMITGRWRGLLEHAATTAFSFSANTRFHSLRASLENLSYVFGGVLKGNTSSSEGTLRLLALCRENIPS